MADEGGVWRTVSGRRIFIRDGQSLTEAMKESGKFKAEGKAEQSEVEALKGEPANPENILPVNEITDADKFAALVYDFEHGGYSGRPILAGELGDGQFQALTGSHRIYAAREAGIDIPVEKIAYTERTAALFAAMTDEERVSIAKSLYESGDISQNAYRLIKYEEEANSTVSEVYADVAKKKAALYHAEKAAKKATSDAAAKAAKAAKEKAATEFAKTREKSPEMAEYKSFLREMNEKYGADNIWRDMDDREYDKMERLERIAYTGK